MDIEITCKDILKPKLKYTKKRLQLFEWNEFLQALSVYFSAGLGIKKPKNLHFR
jgi:hypothetical protein